MRLSPVHIAFIRDCVRQLAGDEAQVRLFGSRLDDNSRGGDVDLLVELPTPVERPARLAAQISARVSRQMHGRKVDVIISAPNLQRLPIHDIARRQGVPL